jgi:cytochrome c553
MNRLTTRIGDDMITEKTVFFLLIAALCAGASGGIVHAAGDPDAGKQVFQACARCHGPALAAEANRQQPVPRLGGQHATYLLSSLDAYAGGKRKHAEMERIAGSLSQQEKEDIAAYLAQFELKQFPIPGSGDAPAAIATIIENCRVCHGVGGNSFVPDYPRINGQDEQYLLEALKSYQNGARTNATMVYVVKNLTEQELRDIAAYYAGQKGGLTAINK